MPRARKDQNQRVQTPRGLPYGQRQEMTQAQQAIPLPNDQARLQAAIEQAKPVQPPDLLQQESQRPWEAPTAGLPTGPGPGPEVLGSSFAAVHDDPDVTQFRAIASQFPHPLMFAILSELEGHG